jgi:hypothetical protein
VAAFAYSCIDEYFRNRFISAFLVLAPSLLGILSFEVLMVTNSIFEILGFFILLIFLYGSLRIETASRRRWIFCFLVFTYTVSNPLGVVLCAVFWADYLIFSSRSKGDLRIAIVASAGTLIESIFVLLNYSDRHLGVGILHFFEYFVIGLTKSFLLVFYIPNNLKFFSQSSLIIKLLIVLFCLLTFSILVILVKSIRVRVRATFGNRFVNYPVFALTCSILISIFTRGVETRFGVMATLYATLILVGMLQFRPGRFQNFGYIVLILAFIVNGSLNFAASEYRSSGPLWSQELSQSKDYCLKHPASSIGIIFAPNWVASISHPYRVSEPTTENLKCVDLNERD